MFKRLNLPVTLAISAAVFGCDPAPAGDTAENSTVTIRDSAGIEIVENHAPEHPAESFWTIDPEPEFVLGGSEDLGALADDSAQLIWRLEGLARLPDGRVAVLSSANQQLMLFEPSGELSRIIGGPGEGPGEFTRPLAFQYLPPDTLVVWDYFLSSIDYFDTDGNLLKERSPDLARMAVHGAGAESLRLPLPDGSFLAGVPDLTVDESPGDCAHLAAHGLSMAWQGSPLRAEGVTIHGEELLRMLQHRAGNREMGGWPRRTEDDEPIPRREKYPAVESIVVDTEGYLWVREWSVSESGIPDQWSVFSPEGRWLGVLAKDMPMFFLCRGYLFVCWIDREFLLVVGRDQFEVERVEAYRIRRGG